MRLVSPLLKHAVYPALHHTGVLGRFAPPGGYAVVNYHGVVPPDHSNLDLFLDGNLVSPALFRRQLQFLRAHYRVIHPEDFRAWIEQGKPLPPRAVLVTCDDGLLNTLTDMLPILQSERVPCLFFMTGASCSDHPGMLWYEELYQQMRMRPLPAELQPPTEAGAPPASDDFPARWLSTVKTASRLDAGARTAWMDRVRARSGPTPAFRSEKRGRLLSVTELRQLAEAGMTIGAHTLTHPILSLCSDDEARRELYQSKLDLERALQRPVWAFAYPFGNSSTMGERELRLARDAGFSCAFLNVEHWGNGAANPFAIPRVHVTLRTTLPEFSAHLSGLHTRLQRAVGG